MNPIHRSLAWLAAFCLALTALSGCSGDDAASDDAYATQAAGVFEIFQGQDDQWYFHLLAGNHEKVLQSEGYVAKAGAEDGIESVKANGVDLANYDLLEAVNGEWYFNLVAQNHQIIATSETYVTRANAERGMETVQALIVQHLRIEAAETGGAAFERFIGADGQYYFHLRAANGEIVLQSEGYVAKAGADDGIASVRENGKLVEQYEIIEAQNGQHYFVLEALNHEIIARGEMYVSLYNAERAVDSIVELLQSEAVADPE